MQLNQSSYEVLSDRETYTPLANYILTIKWHINPSLEIKNTSGIEIACKERHFKIFSRGKFWTWTIALKAPDLPMSQGASFLGYIFCLCRNERKLN